MLIGGGVGVEFFLDSTMTWLRASIEFDDWFVQRLGLLREVDE